MNRLSRSSVCIVASIFTAVVCSRIDRAVGQEAQFGTIQVDITREGTTEPLADVQITVVARGSLAATGFTAQQVLQAVNRGAAVNPELVQMAQDAIRGGPRGALANAAPMTGTTDAAGRFIVQNVPVGEHYVRAQLQNYFGPAINGARAPIASETITVAAGRKADVRISLIKGGTISGRVLDPTGKPLQNSPVQALQTAYDNGTPVMQMVNVKPSDDRGEFRLGVLAPGEYFVVVTPASVGARGAAAPALAPAGEVAMTTLYPNATDPTKAIPITVRAGEDLSGINIQLKTLQGAKISGRVAHTLPSDPPPAPRGGVRPLIAVVGLAPRDKTTLPDVLGPGAGATAAADGTFEISNVPPGSYDLFARLPVANGWGGLAPPERATTPLALGRTTVEVRGGNVDGVVVTVNRGVDVKGRVSVDGQPPAANSVRVSILPDDSAMRINETQMANVVGQIAQYPARAEADGSFTLPFIPEGHYRMQVALLGTPPSSYVADIRQGASSIYDSGFTVGTNGADPVQVAVNTNGGSIQGTVLNAERKPVPRTAVVLVPAPNRRSNPALYKIAQTDAEGRFSMTGVPPGAWKVFAWESMRPGAFQNSDFLQRYETRGTAVTVNAGTRVDADATLIRD